MREAACTATAQHQADAAPGQLPGETRKIIVAVRSHVIVRAGTGQLPPVAHVRRGPTFGPHHDPVTRSARAAGLPHSAHPALRLAFTPHQPHTDAIAPPPEPLHPATTIPCVYLDSLS